MELAPSSKKEQVQIRDGSVASEPEEQGHVEELVLDDEASGLAHTALELGPFDAGKDDARQWRTVQWKIDVRMVFFLGVAYALQFLDKTALGYSTVFGIIGDNHLVNNDFSWTNSIFYFGYILFEFPTLYLMQKMPMARYLGATITVWGVLLLCTAASSSFAGLAVCRFLLGAAESSVSAGFAILVALFFTRHEQMSRAAFFMACNGLGGIIGGLMVYGMGEHLSNARLAVWRYLFIILGSITFAWGILFFVLVPSNPATASFLTHEERIIALRRVLDNRSGTKSRHFIWAQAAEACRDPQVYLLVLLAFAGAIGNGVMSYLSLIIKGFGFSSTSATLMQVPFSAFQATANIGIGILGQRLPRARLILGMIILVPSIIGGILLNKLDHETNQWGCMVAVWLFAGSPCIYTVTLSMLSSNIAGSGKRTVSAGAVVIGWCIGNIASPQFFKNSQKPNYSTGITAMWSGWVACIGLCLILRLYYSLENSRRERLLAHKSPAEIAALVTESQQNGFRNRTDRENLLFRYVL